MVGGKHALVVVACLFAGVGAWGAKVTVSHKPTYASELFGPGHDSPVYPEGMTPVVTLVFPANVEAVAATDEEAAVARVNHDGASIITFELIGAVFDGNVTGLMYNANTNDDEPDTATTLPVPATGTVASIMSGGRKGDSEIVIKVEEASTEEDTRSTSTENPHAITFTMPRLANLALAGANAADANPHNDEMSVKLRATARIVSGEFTGHPVNGDRLTGGVANGYTEKVVLARDSLTLSISGNHDQSIVIDGDSAFTSIKTPPAAKGYVTLATVTVTTKQLNPSTATMGSPRVPVGKLQATAGDDGENDAEIYKAKVDAVPASPWVLHDLDGEEIDEGLRGTLTIHAAGTRGLFNEGDVLFIDYDNDGKMGEGESIAHDGGTMAEGEALSIDSDKSQSFKDGITGNFNVLYMPGGKEHINHDSKIKVTALVEYSDPSAIDEAPKSNYTTLIFDGVGDPIMAYAIPHSTNGNGDKGNVRVRCEQASAGSDEMCRVFLECWDDMGNRGFGEAPMIGQDMVMVWGGDDVEGVVGMDMPMSRHSCRVLSKGDVTVQQLTRDGNSNTLVNNTYVAD